MKLQLLFTLLLCCLQPSFARDAIFLIKGNIVNIHSPMHKQAERIVEQFISEDHPNAYFQNIHNNDWESVCTKLVNFHKAGTLDRIVLIGHSWGAQASWTVARCLGRKAQRDIELIVFLDAVQKPGHPDVRLVPMNVKRVFAASQPDGVIFRRGVSELRRDDGSSDGIDFLMLNFNGDPQAHELVFLKLAQDGSIRREVADALAP